MKVKIEEKDCSASKSFTRLQEVKDEYCSDFNSPVKSTTNELSCLHAPLTSNLKISKRRQTKSQKAGIIFPVYQIITALRKFNSKTFFSEESGVMIASIVEFLTLALLDSARDMTNFDHEPKKNSAQTHLFGCEN
ncbi:hypothetical protein BpHYR1_031587 [Brachionus plicatilis]|uniref:Histone H2A n=1 Tax=Brachionus plicatilis TaxID=10195 RepID=A0A3M7T0G2_BRAPC|nr:hypothetical protein BpHYR1_031587 [Brachionus plicatilis]